MTGLRDQQIKLIGQKSESREAGATSVGGMLAWLFITAALLALPLFAHGCHGDDVDHEPLLIPIRLNSDAP